MEEILDKIPKVFISYAWTSKEYRDKVRSIAERLRYDGVDVIFDEWDLKVGQDKYVFMERCVNDESVDKVLIFCNKNYQEKANKRDGGVGDETAIITPKVYGEVNQEKFLPVILEKDVNGHGCLPAYLSSRIYFDLTDDIEYENLLRTIYEKPISKKPALGRCPAFVDEDEEVDYFLLKSIVNNITKAEIDLNRFIVLFNGFEEEFIKTVREFSIPEILNGENIYKTIQGLKPIRDLCLDVIYKASQFDVENVRIAERINKFLENLYNNIFINESKKIFNIDDCEHYNFFMWEIFTGIVAIYIKEKNFDFIAELLDSTLFLRTDLSIYNSNLEPSNYTVFTGWHYDKLQYEYMPEHEEDKFICYLGQIMKSRQFKNILLFDDFAIADVFISQISIIKGIEYFPRLYIYTGRYKKNSGMMANIWKRLYSKKECKKLLKIFDAESIDILKDKIQNNKFRQHYGFNEAFDIVPNISNVIEIELIATMP